MGRVRQHLVDVVDWIAARGVATESVTIAAVVVSMAAGVALAAGGAAGEPRLWALVPSLGLARLALHVLASALEARRRL